MRALPQAAVIWGGAIVLVIASSCTSLPEIQLGTCGNGVVEPEHNEDCDNGITDDAGHSVCYPAGSSAACHFDCSSSSCPPTFSCGTDNVCRKPKGIFKQTGVATQIDADRLLVGDFNHDGFGDVVAQTAIEMTVLYGDTNDALTQPFTIRQPSSNPAVGTLALDPAGATSEPNSDLVFTASLGVTTWRGRSDHTLAPTPYASLALPTNVLPKIIGAHVIDPTDDVFLLTSASQIDSALSGATITDILSASSNATDLFADIPEHAPSDLVGVPLVAQLDDGPQSPCQEIALAFAGDAFVRVYKTCRDPATPNSFPAAGLKLHTHGPYEEPETIVLPAGLVIRSLPDKNRQIPIGVVASDVNGDGHLDLLIDAAADAAGPADSGATQSTSDCVAFGLGDGTFDSAPAASVADHRAAAFTTVGPIFGIDQLTSLTDAIFDVVVPSGIYLQIPSSPGEDASVSAADAGTNKSIASDQLWNEARIVDIDGDGFKDVLGGGAQRVDIYKGTGTVLMTHIPYAVDGDVSSFTFGDFDADGTSDIAFRAGHPDGTADLDVMWGRLHGMPDQPTVVGQFSKIFSLSEAVVNGSVGDDDGVADLGVVVVDVNGAASISVLPGSTDRQLQAPFFVSDPRGDNLLHTGFPFAYAVGQFNADDRHFDLVTAAAIARLGPLASNPAFADPTLDMKLAFATVDGLAQLSPSPDKLKFTGVFDSFNEISLGGNLPPKVAPVLPTANWTRLSLAAVDLDGPSANGVDEVVGVAPALRAAGAFFTSKFDGTAWNVSPLSFGGGLPKNRTPIAQVTTADLDGDGAGDVLVLSDSGELTTNLFAYINDRSGKLPSRKTTISLPSYASGATEKPFHIVSVAAVDADSDPGKEVAMLTNDGGLFLAKTTDGGASFTVTGPLCNGDVLAACVNNPSTRIPSGQAIAAIDVDGDGIQDLVVESNLSLQVYKGIAVDP